MLTGSASRGVADKYSDIEMMFYVDALPVREDREAWLYDAGALDIVFDTEAPEDSEVWVTFYSTRTTDTGLDYDPRRLAAEYRSPTTMAAKALSLSRDAHTKNHQ